MKLSEGQYERERGEYNLILSKCNRLVLKYNTNEERERYKGKKVVYHDKQEGWPGNKRNCYDLEDK